MRAQHDRASVEDVVTETDQGVIELRNQSVNRLCRVEEPLPSALGYMRRQRGGAGPSVKGVVSLPEGKPALVVRGGDLAYEWVFFDSHASARHEGTR